MPKDEIAGYGVGVAVAAVLVVSTALLFWTVPIADDYCRAGLTGNWLGFVGDQYQNWSGRWAAMTFYWYSGA